jgi:predicted RNase H-like HicB family nuclease
MQKLRLFSLARYVEAALQRAEYQRDEDGIVVAVVPNMPGFFSQGDSFEEARDNLRDAVEGNVLIALQLGLDIPKLEEVVIEEQDVETRAS